MQLSDSVLSSEHLRARILASGAAPAPNWPLPAAAANMPSTAVACQYSPLVPTGWMSLLGGLVVKFSEVGKTWLVRSGLVVSTPVSMSATTTPAPRERAQA